MTRTLVRVLCLVAALVCGTVALAVTPAPAYACQCAERLPGRALRDSDVVFHGTVTARNHAKDGKLTTVDLRLRVDGVYKGTAYADQVVSSLADTTACGLDLEVGSSWVIFANEVVRGTGDRAVNRLVTSLCSGNLATDQPPAILGAARAPRAGASDELERAVRADRWVTRGLAGAAVGVLVLGAIVAVFVLGGWRSRPQLPGPGPGSGAKS